MAQISINRRIGQVLPKNILDDQLKNEFQITINIEELHQSILSPDYVLEPGATDFLSEAINFLNCGMNGHNYISSKLLTKTSWFSIDIPKINKTLEDISSKYESTLLRTINDQLGNLCHYKYLPDSLKDDSYFKRAKKSWWFSAVIFARQIVSKNWRKNGNTKLRPREFIQLDSVASLLSQINKHLDPSYIKESVKSNFGNVPWYNSLAIDPGYSTALSDTKTDEEIRKRFGMPMGIAKQWKFGFYKMGKGSVGLTEKLYTTFLSKWFPISVKKLRKHDPIKSAGSILPFKYLRDSREFKKSFDQLVPLVKVGKNKNNFDRWYKQIDVIENYFDFVLRSPETSYGEFDWIKQFGPNWTIELGFPWALALMSYLRNYLMKLQCLIYLLSVPFGKIFTDVNGYLSLSLWEYYTGTSFKHLKFSKILQRNINLYKVQLQGDQEILGQNARNLESKISLKEDNLILEGLKLVKPLLEGDHKESIEKIIKKLLGIELDSDVDIPWPLTNHDFPGDISINPDFDVYNFPSFKTNRLKLRRIAIDSRNLARSLFGELSLEDRSLDRVYLHHSEYIFGAKCTAQTQIYAATHIMEWFFSIITDLRSDPQKKDFKDNPFYWLGSGSFLFGGRFLDHWTHRDGYRFDMDIRTEDMLEWRRYKQLDDFLSMARKDKKIPLQQDIVGVRFPKELEKRYKSLRFAMPLTLGQEGHPTVVDFIFRKLAQTLIQVKVGKLKNMHPKNIQKYSIKDEEEMAYQKADADFHGFPVFTTSHVKSESYLDVNRDFLVGFVSLYLTRPAQIIWGSPTLYVRSLYLIRFLFSTLEKDFEMELKKLQNNQQDPQSQADDKEKVLLSDSLFKVFKDVKFSFMPHNHHNHYHVDYWDGYLSTKKKLIDPISNIRSILPLWAAFGIDFSPLILHFTSYKEKIINTEDELIRRELSEIENLIVLLEEYQFIVFKDESQLKLTRIREGMKEQFSRFISESESAWFNTFTQDQRSEDLQNLVEISRQIYEQVTPTISKKLLREVVSKKLKSNVDSYDFEELLAEFGLEDIGDGDLGEEDLISTSRPDTE